MALCCLMVMGACVIAGPTGLLAWSESHRQATDRQAEIDQLKLQRDRLQNRVNLVDPSRADPDITSELLRSNLNVVHPDDMVLMLDH